MKNDVTVKTSVYVTESHQDVHCLRGLPESVDSAPHHLHMSCCIFTLVFLLRSSRPGHSSLVWFDWYVLVRNILESCYFTPQLPHCLGVHFSTGYFNFLLFGIVVLFLARAGRLAILAWTIPEVQFKHFNLAIKDWEAEQIEPTFLHLVLCYSPLFWTNAGS